MAAFQLFDLEHRTVLDTLEGKDPGAIPDWLAAHDLVMEDGTKMWSLVTPAGKKTNLAIRHELDNPSEYIDNKHYLQALRDGIAHYRAWKKPSDRNSGLVGELMTASAVCMAETGVRSYIAHSRMYGVPEEDILAALEEFTDLARF